MYLFSKKIQNSLSNDVHPNLPITLDSRASVVGRWRHFQPRRPELSDIELLVRCNSPLHHPVEQNSPKAHVILQQPQHFKPERSQPPSTLCVKILARLPVRFWRLCGGIQGDQESGIRGGNIRLCLVDTDVLYCLVQHRRKMSVDTPQNRRDMSFRFFHKCVLIRVKLVATRDSECLRAGADQELESFKELEHKRTVPRV